MIKKILRHVRQKPKAVREQYAFWSACVVTGAIALVWASQFFTPATNSNEPVSAQVAPAVNQNASDRSLTTDQDNTGVGSAMIEITPENNAAISTETNNTNQPFDFAPTEPAQTQQEIRIATTSS